MGQSGSTAETAAGQELEGLHQELGQVQERLHQALQELDELRRLHGDAQSEVGLHTQSQSEDGAVRPARRAFSKG